MTGTDVRYLIENKVESQIKIKRSVFICRLEKVDTPEKARSFVSKISKMNKNATHNCWAYILGEKGQIFHSSDAGEPAGTAGKPMLNALQHYHLTDVAAVVTRHFGGVKLGVRGLMDAYFESVASAVEKAKLRKNVQLVPYRIELAYQYNDALMNRLSDFAVTIIQTDYSAHIVHDISVEISDKENVDGILEGYQARGLLKIL